MKKSNWLKLIIALGIFVILIAFVVVPDDFPWYFELIIISIVMFPWLFAKSELNRLNRVNKPK